MEGKFNKLILYFFEKELKKKDVEERDIMERGMKKFLAMIQSPSDREFIILFILLFLLGAPSGYLHMGVTLEMCQICLVVVNKKYR